MIGCGAVTEVKSGPGFQKAENSTLTAVMRRSGRLAEDYARRHGVPRWYDDAQGLIDDPEVDAVYIATPPVFHKEYALRCALAGKPVYVEKPMAMNFEECQEMIHACQSAGAPLFVAYYRRALPRFLKIRELIENETIGEVRFINMMFYQPLYQEDLNPDALPWRVLPEIAGGGRFVDLASHMLDFADSLFGPIRSVSGFASNQAHAYPAEDCVSAAFVFESGVHGAGTWCFSAFQRWDSTEIVGDKGKITFSMFDAKPILLTTADHTLEIPCPDPPHVQQPLIQTIVNELNGNGVCPSSGESAARSSLVMDRVLAGR